MKVYGNPKIIGFFYCIVFIFASLGVFVFSIINLSQIIPYPNANKLSIIQQIALAAEALLVFLGLTARFNASVTFLSSKLYWGLLIVAIIVTHLTSLAVSVNNFINVFSYSVFALISLGFCWIHWNMKVEKIDGHQRYEITMKN